MPARLVGMPHIGGTFLSSHNPTVLRDWFKAALDIEMQLQGDGGMVMFPIDETFAILSVQQARPDAPKPPAGPVVAEPYGRQTMMLNIRVEDMAATLAQLKANGDETAGPVDYEGIGTFAWCRTPDGHDIELWQTS